MQNFKRFILVIYILVSYILGGQSVDWGSLHLKLMRKLRQGGFLPHFVCQ